MIPVLIIPILNRYDLLDINLETINHDIREILIINNGKEKYVPKRNDLNIRVLDLPSNLGMSGSWNLGIKLYPHEEYWMFSSADLHWGPRSLYDLDKMSGKDKIIITEEGWGCFTIGENFIREVGLFDEYYYPIYYEDIDYFERVQRSSLVSQYTNTQVGIKRSGDLGSQTIQSDSKLMTKNGGTFALNQKYFEEKRNSNDWSIKGWNIDNRRNQEWL